MFICYDYTCAMIVPGSVMSVSTKMGTTWAVVSWTEPTYIPTMYPVTEYEIGYIESEECVYTQEIMDYIKTNVSSDTYSINITTLSHDTCYVFVVRGYTINGYGLWNGLANVTLDILMETTGISTTFIMHVHVHVYLP